MLALRAGDFALGWREYEYRQSHSLVQGHRYQSEKPLWLGQERLRGKTLLIWIEQGLGDILQFVRYVDVVVAQENPQAIYVVTVANTVSLLALSLRHQATVSVMTQADGMSAYDFHIPVMSLPLACGTDSVASIPSQTPYLFSDTAKRQSWRTKLNDRLGATKKIRVGLVWAGGYRPDQPELVLINEQRNLPLAKLAGLRHPSVDFISLQKGEQAQSELASLIQQGWDGPDITSFSDELHDFSDTAALIDNLDLVITVDTSVAHLAGALGKPVWILNRFDACWRWLYGQDPNRTDSPWYPTARLFRQPKAGDWDSVIDQVKLALQELAAH